MMKRTAITTGLIRTTLVLCAIFSASFFAPLFAQNGSGHIAKVVDDDGRSFFVNAEPPAKINLTATKPRPNIYLPAESSFAGRSRPAVEIGRDGVEKIVREASDRHRVDPALVRAVIQTESNWNPKAYSHKGAGGLMQLIPTTSQRYGAYDVFALHIVPRLSIRGDAVNSVNGTLSSIVRRQGQVEVALVSF